MLKDLNEWYMDVNLSPTVEMITNRKKAIKTYVKDISLKEVCKLVEMFYGFPMTEEDLERFIEVFSKDDATFSKKNKKEIELLIGAILAYLVEFESGYDSLVELFVVCNKQINRPVDFVQIEDTILYQFENDRLNTRESLFDNSENNYENPLYELKKDFENGQTPNDWERKLVDAVFKRDEELWSDLVESVKILKEDSQILWWLNSEWSLTFDQPWKNFEKDKACLTIGKEVSSFVEKFPGPSAIKGVVNLILGKCCKGREAKKDLVEILKNMDLSQKNLCVEDIKNVEFLHLLPIHSAIVYENNTENAEQWYHKYEIETLLNQELAGMTYVDYAMSMYYEELAIKNYLALLYRDEGDK